MREEDEETALAVVKEGASTQSFSVENSSLAVSIEVPSIVTRAGAYVWRAIVEFFTAQIDNDNTRESYARDISRFFRWCDAHSITELARIDSVAVAAYRDALETFELPDHMERRGRRRAKPTIKRNLSALSELFNFLCERGLLSSNPVAPVRRPKFSRSVGKTQTVDADEALRILDAIDTRKPVGVRDRAYIVTLGLCWGRAGEVLAMNVEDYFPKGKRWWFRLLQKGSKEAEIPAHHTAELYMDAWLDELVYEAGSSSREEFRQQYGHTPLFRSFDRRAGRFSANRFSRNHALRMVKRRAKAAGLPNWRKLNNHTWRASGATNYLENGGSLEYAQTQLGHTDIRTTRLYDHRERATSLDEVNRVRLFARDPTERDEDETP